MKRPPLGDRILAGRRLTRFERCIAAAVFVAVLGNGLALTWIQADRNERIEVSYNNCVAANTRTLQGRVAVRKLADDAESDGAVRFAEALRALAPDTPLPVCKR